jgi:hypothetical protein
MAKSCKGKSTKKGAKFENLKNAVMGQSKMMKQGKKAKK